RLLQGSFKDTTPDVLLAEVLSAVLARTGVDPSDVGEVSGTGCSPTAALTYYLRGNTVQWCTNF
ncbi:unnamed protein product, partial [Laminaria digitata]